MIQSYIKIAFRSIFRNPGYSFINIAGLSIGIACTILILLWVYDEVSFNKSFSKYPQIHQIMMNANVESGVITRGTLPMPLKDVLLQQDSHIKRFALTVFQEALLGSGDKRISKAGIDASEDFLNIFDFEMIAGSPDALKDHRSIILTESTANALFGNTDPMGKMVQIKIETTEELKVSGIIKDPPANSSFRIDFILPFSYFEATSNWVQHARGNWQNFAFQYYVELQPGSDKYGVDNAIKDIVRKNISGRQDYGLFLHPMSQWRLYNKFTNGKALGGNIEYVRLFSLIAIFILVIACINFMNLSTARSEHRAREVGIRKTVGSRRSELVLQFFGESILLSVIAFFIAIILVQIALPFYNALVEKTLVIDFTSSTFWMFGGLLVLITGFLAGSYPALYLSSFRPVQVLKGKLMTAGKGTAPRQIMVTMQFCFSILLIIGTLVIYQQIQFLRSRDLGYDQENLMMVWSKSDIEKNFSAIKSELIRSGAAVAVCKSNSPITNIFASSPLDDWPGRTPDQHVEVVNIATEYDYTKTMGIRMLEGRDFSELFKSDSDAMVINKTAVKVLGLTNPLGNKIKMWGSTWTVIGVMDDVLMGTTTANISPLVMTIDPSWSSTISVRLAKTSDLKSDLDRVGAIFKKYNPDYTFEYRFADAEFERKFGSLNMISGLAGSFAILAIFITGLGILGMAAFAAERRTKEIGIRKVLGASVSSLVLLMTKDFSKLVLLAFVIAAPFGAWAVSSFLQQYEVRIAVPLWVFPLTGVAALLFTLGIVSTQAIRAAVDNPVRSLRSE